jgi:hypothetical protein
MSSPTLPPPLGRHGQSLPVSPLRSALKKVQDLDGTISRPSTSRRVTFQSSDHPNETELINGLKSVDPLVTVAIEKNLNKPLPGLPVRRPRVMKRLTGASLIPSQRSVSASEPTSPANVEPMAVPQTPPAKSDRRASVVVATPDHERPTLTSSRTAPLPVTIAPVEVFPPSFDRRATQTGNPFAFIPVMEPTKAPLRGWNPHDLDCPALTRGSVDSIASSRTNSRVTTPSPKLESASGFPFPPVEIYEEDETYNEPFEFKEEPLFDSNKDHKISYEPESQFHPLIQEMLREIDQAHSEWVGQPIAATQIKPEKSTPIDIAQLKKSGRTAQNRRSASTSCLPQANDESSAPTKKEQLPELFESLFQGSDDGGHLDHPEPDLVQPEKLQPMVKKVPRKPVMQSFTRPELQARSQSAVVCSSSRSRRRTEVAKPNEFDLFATRDLGDHKRNYDKGKQMAREIAKDFWAKHAPTKGNEKDRPTTKELLEGLFYHAPADLYPCPERLQFLGIQPSKHDLL